MRRLPAQAESLEHRPRIEGEFGHDVRQRGHVRGAPSARAFPTLQALARLVCCRTRRRYRGSAAGRGPLRSEADSMQNVCVFEVVTVVEPMRSRADVLPSGDVRRPWALAGDRGVCERVLLLGLGQLASSARPVEVVSVYPNGSLEPSCLTDDLSTRSSEIVFRPLLRSECRLACTCSRWRPGLFARLTIGQSARAQYRRISVFRALAVPCALESRDLSSHKPVGARSA